MHEEIRIYVPLIVRPLQGKKSIDDTESSLVGTIKKPVRIWDLYGTIMGQFNWDVDRIIKSGELVKKSASAKFMDKFNGPRENY